jgi:hypothetical protein
MEVGGLCQVPVPIALEAGEAPAPGWADFNRYSRRQILTLLLFNSLNAELKPICHLLALLGAHHILHVSRIRVKGVSHYPNSGWAELWIFTVTDFNV